MNTPAYSTHLEYVAKARQNFLNFKTLSYALREDPQNAGKALYWYAEDQMVHWISRLRSLGVDVSRGLNPLYLRPGAEAPKTEKQTNELLWAASQAMQWYCVWGTGAEIIWKWIGDTAWEETLTFFQWWKPARKLQQSQAEHVSNSIRVLEAMRDMWERAVILQAVGFYTEPDHETQREAAASTLSGWGRANIALRGNRAIRLRRGLGVTESSDDLEATFLSELPNAVTQAVNDSLQTNFRREPLRSTGNRTANLTRRTAAVIEKFAAAPSSTAVELAAFAEREKYLRLGKEAGLTPREFEVFGLLYEHPQMKNREVAAKLGVSVGTVGTLKSRIKRALGDVG
jgi:DNA-binding CsgD family transcriptional regulator